MRALGFAVTLLSAMATSGAPLARLADAVADEIVRAAAGRAVELVVADERLPTRAIDLHSLVAARLEGRVSLTTAGPRVRVAASLSQAATRLVLSARVTEEPSGRLVDLLSASVEADAGVLTLTGAVPMGGSDAVVIRDQVQSSPLADPVVDLAFVGDDRLLTLSPNALGVWRRDGLALRLESRHDLGRPSLPSRRPGGILVVTGTDVWAATSTLPSAVLLALDGGRLRVVDTAQAVPWPSLPRGVRFRPGTNLMEADAAGLGAGPFLGVEGRDEVWLVAADGRLGRMRRAESAWTSTRTGPALALLWPGLLAAASPDAPAARDRIVFLATSASNARGDGVRAAGSVVIDGGAVRALAARRTPGGAVLAAATEEPDGTWRLILLDVAGARP